MLNTGFRTSGNFTQPLLNGLVKELYDTDSEFIEVKEIDTTRAFYVKRRVVGGGESQGPRSSRTLSREFDVYVHLHSKNVTCVPSAVAFVVVHNVEILLVEKCDVALAPRDFANRFGEILNAVRTIHQHGVLHCDLKPDHFWMLGDRVVLLDFDLACPSEIEGRLPRFPDLTPHHLKFADYLQLPTVVLVGMSRGTPPFQPINSLLGYKPSPCWDFESLAYMYVYLYNSVRLPWYQEEERVCEIQIAQLLDPRNVPRQRGDESNDFEPNPEWLVEVYSAVREAAITAHTTHESAACDALVKVLTNFFSKNTDIVSRNPSPQVTNSPIQRAALKSQTPPRKERLQPTGPVGLAASEACRRLEKESPDEGMEEGASGKILERKHLLPTLRTALALKDEIGSETGQVAKHSVLKKFRSASNYEIDGVGSAELATFKKLLPVLRAPSFLFQSPAREAEGKEENRGNTVFFVAEAFTIGTTDRKTQRRTLAGKLAQLQWSVIVQMHNRNKEKCPHPLLQPDNGLLGAVLIVGARKNTSVETELNQLMQDFALAFPFLRVAIVRGVLRQKVVTDPVIVDAVRGRSVTASIISALTTTLAGLLDNITARGMRC